MKTMREDKGKRLEGITGAVLPLQIGTASGNSGRLSPINSSRECVSVFTFWFYLQEGNVFFCFYVPNFMQSTTAEDSTEKKRGTKFREGKKNGISD